MFTNPLTQRYLIDEVRVLLTLVANGTQIPTERNKSPEGLGRPVWVFSPVLYGAIVDGLNNLQQITSYIDWLIDDMLIYNNPYNAINDFDRRQQEAERRFGTHNDTAPWKNYLMSQYTTIYLPVASWNNLPPAWYTIAVRSGIISPMQLQEIEEIKSGKSMDKYK